MIKNENAIEVRKVKKKFKVYFDKGSSLKEKILFKNRNCYEVRWVLNGISFDVKKGEAIGLIGHNGCGKSTTLKLLTRIMYPDEGSIHINGRVSSLIELGAGFHPDMSGRENIYTNASIFGLTRKEIDARMQNIVEFSELEEFLDNPVRTYSSGMYMRLAFSVAINVDADVLLIDEILAVGDVNFQAKCFNKLREIKANGTTIVIVSHSLGQIEQICDQTIWIQEGLIKAIGTPRTIHPEYLDYMGQKRQLIQKKESINRLKAEKGVQLKTEAISEQSFESTNSWVKAVAENTNSKVELQDNKRWGNGNARIVNVNTFNEYNKQQNIFRTGETILVKIEYKIFKEIQNAVFGIGIFRSDGLHCYGTNTYIDKLSVFDLTTDGVVEIKLKNVNLLPGIYMMDIAIQCDIGIAVDYFREAHKIEMYSLTDDIGVIRIDHKWIV